MTYYTTTLELLMDSIKLITNALLSKRLEDNAKNYVKMDYKIFDHDEFFSIQITKCGSELPNLKFLLTKALKNQLGLQSFNQKATIAIVEKKSLNDIEMKKVICIRNASLSLIADPKLKPQKEFSSLKHYLSIKLMFQLESISFDEFASLLLIFIKQIEDTDPNIKFIIKRNAEYVYRNLVPKDDDIMSCKILTESLTRIFKNSVDEDFQKSLVDKLNIEKPKQFKQTVGTLLIAKANKNFSCETVDSQKNTLD